MTEYDNGSDTIVTWKDSYFQYQREIRFAVFNKPSIKPITVKIRNLRDCSNVMDAEFFLKNCNIKIDIRKEAMMDSP